MPSIISAGTTVGTALSLTSDTSGELQIQTNNGATTAMTLTTGGNVGIGTTTPAYPVDIVSNSGSAVGISLRGQATNIGIASFWSNDGVTRYSQIRSASDEFRVQAISAIPITLYTNNTERMRIDSSGNVGIGTSSPAGKLDVGSTSASFTDVVIRSSTTGISELRFADTTINIGYIGYEHTSNLMKFGVNGGDRLVIDSSGNVGIGTNSPDNTGGGPNLTVQAGGQQARVVLRNTASGTASGDGFHLVMDNSAFAIIEQRENQPLLFATNATERMRITPGGALCINSTTSTFQLRSSGVASAHFGDDYDSGVYGCVQITRQADQPDNLFHLAFIRNGYQVAGMGFLDNSNTFAIQNSFNTSGAGVGLTVNATSWSTVSDERKKNIVGNVEDALAKLADWRTVYFKYKTDEEDTPQRVGLIAQDVLATLPEVVSAEEDELKTLQVRYTETVPLLVKAIQELKAELDSVKAELQTLKGA
jgi:trimeric autotransporter adhesin